MKTIYSVRNIFYRKKGIAMKENKRTKSGFTLAELLIVVAIIAILAMISIPIFTSRMEAAKKNTCLYNRKTLKRVLVTEEMTGKAIDLKDPAAMQNLVASMGVDGAKYENGKITGMCPEGSLSVVNLHGSYEILCNEHDEALSTINDNPDLLATMFMEPSTLQYIDKFFGNKTFDRLDSTGPNYGGKIKPELQKMLGLKGDFDFRIDRDGTDGYTVYISKSLKDCKNDDQVEAAVYKVNKNTKKVTKGNPPTDNTFYVLAKSTADTNNKDQGHKVLRRKGEPKQ